MRSATTAQSSAVSYAIRSKHWRIVLQRAPEHAQLAQLFAVLVLRHGELETLAHHLRRDAVALADGCRGVERGECLARQRGARCGSRG